MATYTKLHDGNWGVRVEGSAKAGDRVTVSKKSGESKTETIARVLWSGNGITLCSIDSGVSSDRKTAGRAGMCADCGQMPGIKMCHDSSGISGMCCRQCAAAPSYERSFA